MKKIFLFCAAVAASASMFVSCCGEGGKTPALNDEMDSLAYSIGYQMGANLKNVDSTLNPFMIAFGIRDYFESKGLINRDDMRKFMDEYFMVRIPRKNLEASRKFLAEIEKEKGVKKTESGLLYKVIEEGAERPTSLQDTVRVHYTGMLKNGKKFESSYDAGKDPVQFPLDRVIKGWGEGLQHVGKGGKIILYIPSELAYGERGAGVFIGPNEALIFEVEVFDVFHAKGEKK